MNNQDEYLCNVDDTENGYMSIRLIVSYLQQKLIKLFPETDFVFTDDEFRRQQPAPYELAIDWFQRGTYDEQDAFGYTVTRIELIRPERIVRETLATHAILETMEAVGSAILPYLVEQIAHHGSDFERNRTYRLRLRW